MNSLYTRMNPKEIAERYRGAYFIQALFVLRPISFLSVKSEKLLRVRLNLKERNS